MAEIIVKLGDNVVQKCFFYQETLLIGRSPNCQVMIENLAISREHAKIDFQGGRYFIIDLDSANGTYVNGMRVKKTEIMDKDAIAVGKHMLHFYDQQANVAARAPSRPDGHETMTMAAPEPAKAMLVINKGRQKGQCLAVTKDLTKLGRGPENDIHLTDWFVSKQHAQVERRGQRHVIRDLGSWRHTFVNGEAITEAPLHHGDVILLGPTVELVFETRAERPACPRVPIELGEAVVFAGMSIPEADDAGDAPAPVASQAEAVSPQPAPSAASEPAPAHAAAFEIGGCEPRADLADAVCEDLAEVSLQVAAAAIASRSVPRPEDDETVEKPAAKPAPRDEKRANAPTQVADRVVQAAGEPNAERLCEIAMWERALANASPAIRKQAARRLKQLTGKDYVY
jgi:pSer/pThr/pTyr-binding forkhead associated (FHA) protein